MVKKKLGRGLQALLGMEEVAALALADGPAEQAPPAGQWMVAIDQVEPNPFQPRRTFDAEELAGLTQSIRDHGVLQPIIVRPAGDRYQLIAGERRLRAAQQADLDHIPASLVEADDQQMFALALVENLQRADLDPIEKAQAFQTYLARFGGTQDALATSLGVDRSSVSNLIRLLDLPESIQEAVREQRLSYGHARALLAVADPARQIALWKRVEAESLSVRQTEALVRQIRPSRRTAAPAPDSLRTNHVVSLERELRQRLATQVHIRPSAKDQGTIVIQFQSHDDFERILEVLRRS